MYVHVHVHYSFLPCLPTFVTYFFMRHRHLSTVYCTYQNLGDLYMYRLDHMCEYLLGFETSWSGFTMVSKIPRLRLLYVTWILNLVDTRACDLTDLRTVLPPKKQTLAASFSNLIPAACRYRFINSHLTRKRLVMIT